MKRAQKDVGVDKGRHYKPRISAEFLEDELASMGAAWVKQEYFCEFVDAGGMVFDRQMVEDALSDEIEPLVF